MFRWIKHQFRQSEPLATAPSVPTAIAATSERPAPRRPTLNPGTPVYPAVDSGIAFAPVDEVLNSQKDLIRRLRLLAAMPDDDFELFYVRIIRNLAHHINHLPASEHGTHNGAGGLFRLALEIGFFSLQASESRLFATHCGLEERRVVEPRWRYATFIAGICCELHRPITTMIVVNEKGEEWPSFRKGLGDWLSEDSDRFYVRWVPFGRITGQGASSLLVHKIIPEDALEYLHQSSTQIVPTMLDVITGVTNQVETGPMQDIIDSVRKKVFERDTALRPTQYGKLTVGNHLEPYLLDAMRRLATTGVWAINAQRSRLWYGEDGLFLVWKTAAKEIIELLQKDGVTGVPQDASTLLELLLKINVFDLDTDESPFWTIISPLTNAELLAVKFTSPLTILASLPEEPEMVGMLRKQNVVATAPAAAAKADSQLKQAQGQTTQSVPSSEKANLGDPVAQESAPVAAAEVNRSPLINPVDEKPSGAALPPELAGKLSPLVSDVISALLEDHRSNKTKGATGKISEGFAIGVDQLANYGADVTSIIAELSKLGWIFTYPEKPGKKIHQVEINNKPLQSVILKASVARDLGYMK